MVKSLCNIAQYVSLMTEQCPKTCGKCPILFCNSAPITRCVDLLNPKTGKSDCPSRKELCGNSVYKEVMKEQCPVTCNLCTPSPTTARPATAAG
ncbi:unnamed protein product [Strongylus vulgaris]|uniref:ShKT domain-containing protein n=1 Tax=Strongylus vulgaris TaxID=40348 RepID=A0A3P7J558_STRVU|nr:unnamed protein product [Strongylus vulgaris]